MAALEPHEHEFTMGAIATQSVSAGGFTRKALAINNASNSNYWPSGPSSPGFGPFLRVVTMGIPRLTVLLPIGRALAGYLRVISVMTS
ncbi:hypothetical protein N7528_008126 [Penicillium herquei]|nr:hypothetical protein N7528_008126 [Penicillium herquei]